MKMIRATGFKPVPMLLGVVSLMAATTQASGDMISRDLPSEPRVIFDIGKTGAFVSDSTATVNIDVFWCDGDGRSGERALAASELAAAFATASAYVLSGAPVKINQARTRPIEINLALDAFPTQQDLIRTTPVLRFDPNDQASNFIIQRLHSLLLEKRVYILPGLNESYVPGYIAIYICSNPYIGQIGQVFFQIKNESLSEQTIKSIDDLNKKYTGIKFVRGIEIVGDQSPQFSEIRFFHEGDRELAKSLAADLSTSMNTNVQPKYVVGYDTRVRPGTLEAWLVP